MSAMVIIAYSNNLLDVMVNSIARQLCCQFELLRRRLERFTDAEGDDEEQYERLVYYIKYQKMLYESVEDTGNIICPMAFAQFSVSGIVLCSTLYRMAKVINKIVNYKIIYFMIVFIRCCTVHSKWNTFCYT